jgi:uncharacterized protein (DUF1697 family)
MPQYVAFLRGINVGGHRVKMDRLQELFEELNLRDVSTFLASGNVVFSANSGSIKALTEKIEGHLAQELGYDVPTFLRSPAELAEFIAFQPPEVGEDAPSPSSDYVIFLRSPAPPELRSRFDGLASETDGFRVSGSQIYWRVQGKLSESPLFGKELEKALKGFTTTMRNMNTIRRISAKAPDPETG